MSLRVSVDEGHALEVLDLLCRGRAIRVVPAQPLVEPSPQLTELAGRRLATASLRLLVDLGRREQVVLRGGRRVRGRVWDAARTAGFRLRFTAASFELWVQTTQRLAEISRSAEVIEGQGSTRRVRRQIRRIIKIGETDTGDWLLYALAVRHLERVDMPREIREDLGRRLCMGSPLASLFALEDGLAEAQLVLGEHLDRLLEDANVPLLECLEDLMAEQWAQQISACMRGSSGAARTERLNVAATVLETYVDCLDRAGRLDLCGALVGALARLLASAWVDEPGVVAQRVLLGAGLHQRAQQGALQRALARVVQLGERLAGLRERMAREGFGDARYEESQLFLELVDVRLRPHLPRLAALANVLTGRLG